jgi:hypothetical protein
MRYAEQASRYTLRYSLPIDFFMKARAHRILSDTRLETSPRIFSVSQERT